MTTPQAHKKSPRPGSRKAIYRQERQRQYVGNLVVDNLRLHIEMIMSGFPVKSTQAQAISGNCQLWEEEKQAYLACEKVSLVDAVNHFGSDFILDLTTSSLLQNDPEVEEATFNLPSTSGDIRTISITSPISIGSPSNWNCDVFITTTSDVCVPRSLGSKDKSTVVHPVYALDNVVCDYTSAEVTDNSTTAVVIDDTIVGVYKEHVGSVSIKGSRCCKLCTIPTNVLDILVREDPDIANKCRYARKILKCDHLSAVQLPLRSGHKPDYGRHTLIMGRTGCSKGWRFEDHFPAMLYPRGKKDKPYPPEDFKKGRNVSPATETFLENLRNPDVALRTLHHLVRLTEGGVGHKTKYLWQYGYEPGAIPKCEVFPMRGAR